MKKGFEVLIQENMSVSDKEIAKKYADMFIDKTTKDPKMRYFGSVGGGYTSGLWRGRYGIEINFYHEYRGVSKTIVFRRISKNKRQFGLCYADELIVKNDKFLDRSHSNYRDIKPDGDVPSMCKCSRHKGSLVVDWKNGKPNFESYFIIGEIKG